MAETQNIVKDYFKVKYITLEAAVLSLGAELINEIKPLNEIANTSISSVSSACSTTSSRLERPTSSHEVFMGKLLEQKIFPPIPPTNSQSVRLKLQEVTQTNEVGKIFQLMLYSQIAAHWSDNDNLKTLPANKGSVLVVFKCANLKTTRKGDVQFTLTHLNINLGARIWIKQYFTSLQEAKSPVYIYQPLLEAVSQGARKHVSIYAVIHSIIKPPRETKNGKFYSMICVVDPSCYHQTHGKINDIVLHIFASTLTDFPVVFEGDVVRLHRALIQETLQSNKLDIRIFSEKDVVVFPLDKRQEPHTAAAHYTITVEDMKTVERLLAWSLKYFKPQGMNQDNGPVQAKRNDNVVTLAEINSNDVFHLPCRLVAMFDEGDGVALWVEDGTRCPLLTSSIVTDYNSQETDMVEGNVYQIRIRSHKEKILSKEPLVPGKSLLFLREVHPTVMAKTDEGNIIQFEVMGHVETLPPTPVTRYVKSLTQRLGKMRSNNPSAILMPPPNVEIVQPLPGDLPTCSQVPQRIRSPERSLLELAAPVAIENVPSPQRSPTTRPSPHIVAEPSTEDSPGRRVSRPGFQQGDLMIPSSGESATERAMLEMPIPEIVTLPPPSSIVLADLRRENQRLQKLVLEEDGSQLPAVRPVDIAPLEEASFSQVIASTQKSPPLVAHQEAENSQDELEESSEEMPNGQRLPSSPSGMESPSQINQTQSQSESPHPVFRAVEEVLEIRTTLERDDEAASNQLNMSINNLGSSPNQQRRVTRSSRVTQQLAVEVSSCLRMSDRKRRNSPSKEEINPSPVTKIRRRDPSSSSSNESVMEVNLEGNSQDSDDENASVVLLPLSSQPNLELFYRRVEESVPNEYLGSLAEADSIRPGDRFRVTTQIAALASTNDPQSGLMESLIVAICSECRHLWQYHHFKNSVSQRVRRTHRWKPPVQGVKETLHDEAVMNFLGCEQEDHEAIMKFLREDPSPELKAYDYDENEFMDRSYFYICPLCSQRGLPDSMIVLDPGFFFFLHLKDANRESETDQPESETCLHVMATGVHAEYLLGTKADHVLRSSVIWKKAEDRLSQMLQHGRNNKSLTLSIRRSPISPKEFCIEHTYLVYGARHILPWF